VVEGESLLIKATGVPLVPANHQSVLKIEPLAGAGLRTRWSGLAEAPWA
jgi:hypothetical protein